MPFYMIPWWLWTREQQEEALLWSGFAWWDEVIFRRGIEELLKAAQKQTASMGDAMAIRSLVKG